MKTKNVLFVTVAVTVTGAVAVFAAAAATAANMVATLSSTSDTFIKSCLCWL